MIFSDAEGAEVMVLRKVRNYIRRYRPSVVLEAFPRLLARAGFNLQDLYCEIRGLDYEAFEISRMGLARIELEKPSQKSNWLCVHSSRPDVARVIRKHLRMCGLLPCVRGLNPLTKSQLR